MNYFEQNIILHRIYIKCYIYVIYKLNKHLLKEKLCQYECEDNFNSAVDNCPCNSGCPNGCPCPNYDCPSVSTTTEVTTISTTGSTEIKLSSVLVLYNQVDASLTNSNGDLIELTWNNQGDVNSRSFCSLTFQNRFFIFG